jgi:hypothetical protein
MLRESDDDSLVRLLHVRPQLAFPAPAAFSALAARATTRHAVLDALDDLNAAELTVARAASVLPTPFTVRDVTDWTDANDGDESTNVEAAVDELRRRALIWGSESALRPVRVLVIALETAASSAASGSRAALTPPDLTGLPRQRPALVDKAAAGSAFEFLRQIEVLVEHSDHQPVRLTQAGRLAVRDVRALGQLLDLEPPAAQWLLEFAHAAGFMGLSSQALNEVAIPTDLFDEWRGHDLVAQWRHLADVWLNRHLGSGPAEMKALLIAAFGDPGEGRVPSTDDLRGWLAWHRPRRAATWARALPVFVAQAASLGMTGLGALASFAAEHDAGSLGELLPDLLDHVLVQADLTAIAPGPLRPDIAADFAAIADVESRGGATVFRFTRESLTHAMALGWSADDILAVLRTRSRTPLPQPLAYMVRDVERSPAAIGSTHPGERSHHSRDRHRRPRRAKPYAGDDDPTPGDRLDDAFAREIVRTLRNNDSVRANADPEDYGPYSEALGTAPLDTIREAVETQEVVWIAFVDRLGTRREQTAHVASVDDGLVRGTDAGSGGPIAVPVSRVVAAHIIRSTASH